MNKTYRPITSPPPVVYSPRAEQELLSRRKQIKSNYSKQPPCYALPMEVQKDNRVLHLLKSHVTSSNNLLKRSMHTENPLLVCMYPTEPNAPQIPILRNITITNQHMKSPQVHHNVSENEMLPCSVVGSENQHVLPKVRVQSGTPHWPHESDIGVQEENHTQDTSAHNCSTRDRPPVSSLACIVRIHV